MHYVSMKNTITVIKIVPVYDLNMFNNFNVTEFYGLTLCIFLTYHISWPIRCTFFPKNVT